MLTPAVLSYEGIAFQYMAPSVFEDRQFEYIQNHLRILSAFYGVLKPMDGVTPYRLEMQARVGIGDTKNLYEYWGNLLYRSVIDDSRFIINLASKEYSKCIEKYLSPQDRYISIIFCELSEDKMVTKGTSVSYTHLDVYKRQEHDRDINAAKNITGRRTKANSIRKSNK